MTHMMSSIVSFSVVTAYFLTIITEPRRYALSQGETVVLVCDFHADEYNLFDYPVLWIKTQHHEATQVNIMSNLNPPFVDTGRFDVSFSATPPRYRLELIIEGTLHYMYVHTSIHAIQLSGFKTLPRF